MKMFKRFLKTLLKETHYSEVQKIAMQTLFCRQVKFKNSSGSSHAQ